MELSDSATAAEMLPFFSSSFFIIGGYFSAFKFSKGTAEVSNSTMTEGLLLRLGGVFDFFLCRILSSTSSPSVDEVGGDFWHFQHWTRDDSFKLKDLLCSQSCFSEQLPELMPSLESPVSQRSGNPIRWDRRYLRGNVFVEYGVLVFGTLSSKTAKFSSALVLTNGSCLTEKFLGNELVLLYFTVFVYFLDDTVVAEEVGTSNIVVASLNGSRLMNLELIWSSALPMLERRELDRENAGEAMIELFLDDLLLDTME